MGYHGCPIEPCDWSNGPDEGNCANCDGTGYITDSYGEDVDCPNCQGSGWEDYEPMEGDVDIWG